MSFTTTVEASKVYLLHLSPSKKRRSSLTRSKPEPLEIWKWTLTSEATASCFIKDALEMKEEPTKDLDFFWLGSVPCRNIRLVGIIVGVQVYEKRIMYTIDDGTSVIDCIHRPPITPASPKKPRPSTTHQLPQPELPIELKPIAGIGTPIRVVGKVAAWRDSRQIHIDNIEICTSFNEELYHWKKVVGLHKNYYSLPGPFMLPATTASRHLPEESNVFQPKPPPEPRTPSRTRIISAATTPSTCSTQSSPTKSINLNQSPIKLRHPSRLHSRDLTENTFRIYLKHYMDNAPSTSHEETDSESEVASYLSQVPSTPTKSKRPCAGVLSVYETNLETPRPRRNAPTCDQTPRSSSRFLTLSNSSSPQGFSPSYLRRVPELAYMARMVVKAEAKRRAREERRRLREQPRSQSSQAKIKSNPVEELPASKIASKMKRLFIWAIVKLHEEGSIFIWDGPKRVSSAEREISRLWKINSSAASTSADSTIYSVGEISQEDEDEGNLSDPSPDEESYIPSTPIYLAPFVEKAITALMGCTSKPSSKKASTSPLGPTKEEITSYMRRLDGRWSRLGDWAVNDALESLRKDGQVWCVGNGRWEVCL